MPAHLRKLVEKGIQGRGAGKADDSHPVKPTKYHSRQAEDPVMHVLYDSGLEARGASELEADRLAGRIAGWSWGPRFVLQRDPERPGTLITYRPDFIVWPTGGEPWYAIDYKAIRTQQFNLRVRMWRVRFPGHKLVLVDKDGVRTEL